MFQRQWIRVNNTNLLLGKPLFQLATFYWICQRESCTAFFFIVSLALTDSENLPQVSLTLSGSFQCITLSMIRFHVWRRWNLWQLRRCSMWRLEISDEATKSVCIIWYQQKILKSGSVGNKRRPLYSCILFIWVNSHYDADDRTGNTLFFFFSRTRYYSNAWVIVSSLTLTSKRW